MPGVGPATEMSRIGRRAQERVSIGLGRAGRGRGMAISKWGKGKKGVCVPCVLGRRDWGGAGVLIWGDAYWAKDSVDSGTLGIAEAVNGTL
jgi:hypothetical protein